MLHDAFGIELFLYDFLHFASCVFASCRRLSQWKCCFFFAPFANDSWWISFQWRMTIQVGIRGWVKEELDEELSMGLREKTFLSTTSFVSGIVFPRKISIFCWGFFSLGSVKNFSAEAIKFFMLLRGEKAFFAFGEGELSKWSRWLMFSAREFLWNFKEKFYVRKKNQIYLINFALVLLFLPMWWTVEFLENCRMSSCYKEHRQSFFSSNRKKYSFNIKR